MNEERWVRISLLELSSAEFRTVLQILNQTQLTHVIDSGDLLLSVRDVPQAKRLLNHFSSIYWPLAKIDDSPVSLTEMPLKEPPPQQSEDTAQDGDLRRDSDSSPSIESSVGLTSSQSLEMKRPETSSLPNPADLQELGGESSPKLESRRFQTFSSSRQNLGAFRGRILLGMAVLASLAVGILLVTSRSDTDEPQSEAAIRELCSELYSVRADLVTDQTSVDLPLQAAKFADGFSAANEDDVAQFFRSLDNTLSDGKVSLETQDWPFTGASSTSDSDVGAQRLRFLCNMTLLSVNEMADGTEPEATTSPGLTSSPATAPQAYQRFAGPMNWNFPSTVPPGLCTAEALGDVLDVVPLEEPRCEGPWAVTRVQACTDRISCSRIDIFRWTNFGWQPRGQGGLFCSTLIDTDGMPKKISLVLIPGRAACLPPFEYRPVDNAYPVTLGEQGDIVKAMQVELIKLGLLDDAADGSFGPNTFRAVYDFQYLAQITPSGMADTDTLLALGVIVPD